MAKTHQRPPEDDWAGLAQNLFGINLDKDGADNDLLNEDLFLVEIPKLPEPTPVEPPAVPVIVAAAATAPVIRKSVVKPKPKPSDDPFGAGILEDTPATEDEEDEYDGLTFLEVDDAGLTLADEPSLARRVSEEDDDGLTLSPDYDAEGLTLPPDYDDGLTLAPELLGEIDDDSEEDEELEADEPKPSAAAGTSGDRPPRRKFRKREDAYWDLLENFDWQEITDDSSPRSSERSGFRGGDRGPRRGSDRGGDRPRRSSSGDRPRPAAEAAGGRPPRTDSPRGDRPDSRPTSRDGASTSGSGDRPRDQGNRGDRGPRERPRRDDGSRREAPRGESVSARRSETPPIRRDVAVDDFAFGIFEDERPRTQSPIPGPRVTNLVDEEFAPSAESDDRLVERRDHGSDAVADDVVWGEDDSDVRLTPANREMERLPSDSETFGMNDEQSALPAAERWDESEEGSDVRPTRADDDGSRRPRRRRRRRGGEEPARSENSPAQSDEGTVFDLNDVLSGVGELPDQVLNGVGEVAAERPHEDGEETGERRGRRRRRRRPVERSAIEPDGFGAGVDGESPVLEEAADDEPEEREPEEVVLPQISYGKVPSWEEALRYLLNPNLVGRNLGPEDELESLEGDPRGSGGSEPISAPPQRRFRRSGGSGGGSGGGNRGRRPPPRS